MAMAYLGKHRSLSRGLPSNSCFAAAGNHRSKEISSSDREVEEEEDGERDGGILSTTLRRRRRLASCLNVMHRATPLLEPARIQKK